jgi:membrane protease YdiL (CAAX protease family)
MERVRETALAVLILFLLIGSLFIIYSLLMWQMLPKALGMSLLFALVLLKSTITSLRGYQAPQELNSTDARLIKFILLSILSVFFIVLFISYLLKSQQQPTEIAFGISLLTIKRALDFLPAD